MSQQAASPSFNSLTGQAVRVKVVDVGANPIDTDAPYSEMLRAGDADIVGFEPNPQGLAELNRRRGPNETYLPYAIGDGKRHTLSFCRAPGMTSLLQPNPRVLNLFHGFPQWSQVTSREEVDTVRLDDIPETALVDLLKMDIQGAELMVLRNAEARLADALVIQTEVEFLPMYVDQPLFADVDLFLRKHDFVFHRFFPTVSRVIQPMLVNQDIYAGMSQTVWADAIFVRDFTRLELLKDGQLLRMAGIMHDCYKSYDLVLHLLLEHDRRSGGHLGPTYLAALTGTTKAAA